MYIFLVSLQMQHLLIIKKWKFPHITKNAFLQENKKLSVYMYIDVRMYSSDTPFTYKTRELESLLPKPYWIHKLRLSGAQLINGRGMWIKNTHWSYKQTSPGRFWKNAAYKTVTVTDITRETFLTSKKKRYNTFQIWGSYQQWYNLVNTQGVIGFQCPWNVIIER